MKRFLAFDIGASSGRAIVGSLDKKKLTLDEIYRFPNSGIKKDDSLIWDINRIYSELLNGLRRYKEIYGTSIDGLGIDAWSFTRESSSNQPTLLPLIFAAGGIRAQFYMEGRQKVARFQLAQCSLKWLKGKVVKMPILRSYFNVLDPYKPYTGKWSQGISFVFKRPKEIRAPKS